MTQAVLTRMEQSPTETVGTLSLDGELICWTLELPWKDNQRNESCIPRGWYTATREISTRHGLVFRLDEVPDRDNILLGHAGNSVADTTGCILLGTMPGTFLGRRWLFESRRAVRRWQEKVQGVRTINLLIGEVLL